MLAKFCLKKPKSTPQKQDLGLVRNRQACWHAMSLTGRHDTHTFIYYLNSSLLHLGKAFLLCIKYIYDILYFLTETHDSCSLPNRQDSHSPPTSASLQNSSLSTTIPTPLWPPSSRSRRSRGTASAPNTSGLEYNRRYSHDAL